MENVFNGLPLKSRLKAEWDGRADKSSWKAAAIKDELVSQVKERTGANVGIIKTLVALAPLDESTSRSLA